MPIPYRKQFVKSDGRKLNRTGPRDMQARVDNSGSSTEMGLTELLTNQIAELKAEVLAIKSRSGDTAPLGFFSPEQVDEEIRKAVETAVSEASISFKGISPQNADLMPLVKEYKIQIVELQKGNDNLTKLHAAITRENKELKDSMEKLRIDIVGINDLRKQIAVLEQEVSGKQELIDTLKTRPAIVGDEFIDPKRPQMEQVFVDPLEDNAAEGMKASIQIETITKEEEVGGKVDKLRNLLGKLPTK